MTLKWGNTTVSAVKWGSTNCSAVYWGSTKVWPDTYTLTVYYKATTAALYFNYSTSYTKLNDLNGIKSTNGNYEKINKSYTSSITCAGIQSLKPSSVNASYYPSYFLFMESSCINRYQW